MCFRCFTQNKLINHYSYGAHVQIRDFLFPLRVCVCACVCLVSCTNIPSLLTPRGILIQPCVVVCVWCFLNQTFFLMSQLFLLDSSEMSTQIVRLSPDKKYVSSWVSKEISTRSQTVLRYSMPRCLKAITGGVPLYLKDTLWYLKGTYQYLDCAHQYIKSTYQCLKCPYWYLKCTYQCFHCTYLYLK